VMNEQNTPINRRLASPPPATYVIIFAVFVLAAQLVAMSAPDAAAMSASAVVGVSPAARLVRQIVVYPNYVTSLTDYTAKSDMDGLLGLPGQYVAKASFIDSSGIEGTVEVFATSYDCSRRQYALGTTSQDALIANGRVLLRLFNQPSYRQTSAYQQAMDAITSP
jgi:hypothetical protein